MGVCACLFGVRVGLGIDFGVCSQGSRNNEKSVLDAFGKC